MGDIVSESIEIGSQFGSRDVLGDRYPGQHRGVLVFWVGDGGFEMIDAVQSESVLTFGRQAYCWWKGGSELIGRDIAFDKLLFQSAQVTRTALPGSEVGYSRVQALQRKLPAAEV